MRNSFWGYLLIVLGIGIIITMILIYSYTSTNENDYYLLKETTEAAMIDAIEQDQLKNDKVVMNKAKFMESFIRRFSEVNNVDREYKINFYKIVEDPPLAVVEVKTTTGNFVIDQDLVNVPIVNRITGIIETK